MSFAEWFEHLFEEPHHTVVVKQGDSLWRIALDVTGDGEKWQELAGANRDRKWTRDYMIRPGEELRIPVSWDRYAGKK
jgi:nucleoid-associated protein YgaU